MNAADKDLNVPELRLHFRLGSSSLAIFRLVLCPAPMGEIRAFVFEAEDAAQAFAYVERQSDFIDAEIWQDGQILAKVQSSPETGKLWTVNP